MAEWLARLGVYMLAALPFLGLWLWLRGYDKRDLERRLAAERYGWTSLPPRLQQVPPELRSSVLGAFRSLWETWRVLAVVEGRPCVVSDLSVDRITRLFAQDLTLAEFELARMAPHVLIVPKSSRFISGATLTNDYHLRPMELEGRPVQLYVPEGFEIEALEVLEPDVWEELGSQQVVVELNGAAARFIWVGYRPMERLEPYLRNAARLVDRLYGVAPSELVGAQEPELKVNRLVGWLSSTTMPDLQKILRWVLVATLGAIIVLMLLHPEEW